MESESKITGTFVIECFTELRSGCRLHLLQLVVFFRVLKWFKKSISLAACQEWSLSVTLCRLLLYLQPLFIYLSVEGRLYQNFPKLCVQISELNFTLYLILLGCNLYRLKCLYPVKTMFTKSYLYGSQNFSVPWIEKGSSEWYKMTPYLWLWLRKENNKNEIKQHKT